ncbi:hypothetical protein GLOIN_2v1626566 [Rhizophagus irregularis DAOM 181602=DAOM 197198]|uniref:Uncharacterized protein n=1 Tax=Rhizophagus irregularis (strain DAOM 181602 / DAOM 197198 / MUCL 43194) TaxID=747089 RepID=A0A2P4PVK6_RHIID|nr:hypothetical protein GLOIN_2v1626566 [Rhizophagus irregularis DAOM 181602=DAOM 197198]POG69433.1 hypothetical protein GLOIN_2v1626566 [Rhizophagus irregularis DAOM 181602=DAOM 197198]|eukprot:XP_025176299.1 hypothetical protein GLOIN_2v1626566 [Rhizophagus irregularis DAOM 181602=DAOM 197198]
MLQCEISIILIIFVVYFLRVHRLYANFFIHYNHVYCTNSTNIECVRLTHVF